MTRIKNIQLNKKSKDAIESLLEIFFKKSRNQKSIL